MTQDRTDLKRRNYRNSRLRREKNPFLFFFIEFLIHEHNTNRLSQFLLHNFQSQYFGSLNPTILLFTNEKKVSNLWHPDFKSYAL